MSGHSTRWPAYMLAFAMVLTPLQVLAGWFPAGRLTYDPAASATSSNNARCVAGEGSGGFHVVWQDKRDGTAEVYYKHYDGIAWGGDARLSTLGFNSETPAVATGEGGDVHVVWSDQRDGFREIYYKKYDGAAWSADTRLTVSTGDSRYPSVCAAGGRVCVVWVDDRTGVAEVYCKTYDGSAWSADELISSATGIVFYPSAAADDGGMVHVVWYEYTYGARAVYYTRYDGASWSAPENITTASSSAQNPCIAVGADGHVHVVWHDYRDGNFEIYYKAWDGAVWSADERLTDDPGISQCPSICVDASGHVHVVWQDYGSGQSGIKHRVYDGSSWSAIGTLSSPGNVSANPSISPGSVEVSAVWYETVEGSGDIFWTRTYHAPLPAPAVSHADPDSGMSNQTIYGLAIVGGNFVFPDSVWLEAGGEQRVIADSVIVVSPDTILCRLDLRGVTYGRYDIAVKNPDGQVAVADSAFRVNPLPEGPYITYVFPDEALTGTITAGITMVGGNFVEPLGVWLARDSVTGPEAYDLDLESDEVLTFTINLSGVDPGEWDVVVRNADGRTDTLRAGFRVLPGWSPAVNLTNSMADCRLPRSHARCLAVGPGGTLHVVWADYRFGNPEIYYMKFNGVSWEAEQQISHSDGAATEPAVAVSPFSKVGIAWTDTRDEDPDTLFNEEIYYIEYGDGHWGPETRVTQASEASNSPAIVADAAGNMHVVWSDDRGGSARIYYNKYDGTAWEGEIILSTSAAPCTEPSIAEDGLGNLHVAWVTGTTNMDVHYIPYCGEWGTVIPISSATMHVRTPSIAATADGKIYVAWRQEIGSGVHRIYFRENDGATWQPFEPLSDNAACAQPSIAADRDGILHLAWRFYDTRSQDIFYRMREGISWSAEAAITGTVSTSDRPCLAVDVDGTAHMVWEDDLNGSFDIFYARRDAPQLASAGGNGDRGPAALLTIAPNPVAGGTRIMFAPCAGKARVAVYDIRGRLIWHADAAEAGPGANGVFWNACDAAGRQVSPGVYFARLENGAKQSTAKVVVLK
jgi:hypothetical protein